MLTHPLSTDTIFLSRRKYDERLGNFAIPLPGLNQASEISNYIKKESNFVICGYPDDEGVRLNSGRPGAAEGPDAIRSFFYKMTPKSFKNVPAIYDLGNIDLGNELGTRHRLGKNLCAESLKNKSKWIALGGGHDYAFSEGAGFLETYGNSKQKPLVLNFDAHLDVRALDRGLNSGTPFRRLLQDYKSFDFAEIGIQELCNNPEYVEWVKNKKGKILWNDEVLLGKKDFLAHFKRTLGPWLKKNRPTFVSIDIDGFSSSHAPGCSQSWPGGFTPHDFFKVFDFILKTLDVRVLGIYEVSPPLDLQNQTSKLAAEIIYRYIYGSRK
ncbi:MAG: hypothetical protein A4S09_04055 [Proteobacteria bacterium SG_bin7]|nr:MAG: hypothetical protein A4S09_04055 [Proteobacteria bacterium SG_bin7]